MAHSSAGVPNKADILAIRKNPRIPPNIREDLLDVASKDVSLAHTFQLMAFVVGFDDTGFANAREFATQVLKMHPAFESTDIVTP